MLLLRVHHPVHQSASVFENCAGLKLLQVGIPRDEQGRAASRMPSWPLLANGETTSFVFASQVLQTERTLHVLSLD
jgi:hypothetical protein